MDHETRPPAVCLVSGGMDSAVVLAEARAAGFAPRALSFDYGQRHAVELEAAERVARAQGAVDHRTVRVDLSALGGSALTGSIDVPTDRPDAEIGAGVPITYVPARNTVFLSVALGWAEVLGATDLFVGVNAVDYSGYPDCRPAFLGAFEALAALATAAGTEGGARFRVHAPLMELSKADIVRRAAELDVDLGLTHTCYDPWIEGGANGARRVLACGRCDACRLRLAGFAEAGVVDPIAYADAAESKDLARASGTTAALRESTTLDALARVLRLAARLRAPDGCPWDREQTVRTLAPALVEESFEAVDALDELARSGDATAAVEEIGDLLFAVALLCQVAAEEGAFDLAAAADHATKKLVRRHPHVFGERRELDPEAALAQWEAIKAAERAERGAAHDRSALAGVPVALPALQRAARLGTKAMATGFRWPDASGALAKVREEVEELGDAFASGERVAVEHELGDVLLAAAQLANYLDLDPETCARAATQRFESRFRSMETELGPAARDATLDQWMAAWGRAKRNTERTTEA
ncbi:Nucleoside triphosphate pyrophosphohydrolase [Planctomycetes bacterium Pla163]|uniref:7-cyano-7-deazaguanine synthase n=1 Tax=Rohdeia mirabilis TaxID=2528008 RepID=A0A518CYC8_9BACT|nr:Nucleoside triphosphate pyrophosphohydrolase [Planctomycetes bacterium Pla163]